MPRHLLATSVVLLALHPLPVAAQAANTFHDGVVINGSYQGAGRGTITTINASGFGLSNPPASTVLYVRGPDGVGAMEDLFVYTGSTSANLVSPTYLQQTRSGTNNGGFKACPKGQWVAQWGAKTFDGLHENSDAYIVNMCTENQTPSADGMGYMFLFKPNGATNAIEAMAISREGKGGVTIGDVDRGVSLPHVQPYDLGLGTLNAASDLATGGHLRTYPNPGQPRLSACGAAPVLAAGTDQAGRVTVGAGSPRSCTITFARSWGRAPVCIAQVFGAPSPAAYLADQQPASITVAFTAAFKGSFQYICMGVS